MTANFRHLAKNQSRNDIFEKIFGFAKESLTEKWIFNHLSDFRGNFHFLENNTIFIQQPFWFRGISISLRAQLPQDH